MDTFRVYILGYEARVWYSLSSHEPQLMWWGPTAGAAWPIINRLARMLGVEKIYQGSIKHYVTEPFRKPGWFKF